MKIEIGNNNKIKNSNIGKKISTRKSNTASLLTSIFITVIAGVILLVIEYFFNVIGLFQN